MTIEEALRTLLRDRGTRVLDEPPLVRGLLLDYCPFDADKINRLTVALEQRMPQRILERERASRGALTGVLADELRTMHGMTAESAAWAVRAWSDAVLPDGDAGGDEVVRSPSPPAEGADPDVPVAPQPSAFDPVLDAAQRVAERLGPRVPVWRLPRALQRTMAVVSGVAAGLVGVMGVLWSVGELFQLTEGSQFFAEYFSTLAPLNTASLLAGLLLNLGLVVGAVGLLRFDVRGAALVWVVTWALVAVTVAGVGWITLLMPTTDGWAALAPGARTLVMRAAWNLGITGLVLQLLVLFLVSRSGSPRPAAR